MKLKKKILFSNYKWWFLIIAACLCNDDGSRDITCDDDTGKCACKTNVIGDKCEFCTPGNTGFPACHGKTFNSDS